jgi:hypothetical protein
MVSTLPAHLDDHFPEDPLALPIPAHIADQFSLRYHIALATMKVGKGNAAAAQALLEMVLAAGLLADCGYGRLDVQQTRAAERALRRTAEKGLRSRKWKISADGFDALCTMVTEHDIQLIRANARDVMRVLAYVYDLSQRGTILATTP